MELNLSSRVLGGLSPAEFMQRHWQRRPRLVRAAFDPDAKPLPIIDRPALFALAARAEVESRLIVREGGGWQVTHGPLARRRLPPLRRPGWTMLVQGVDLHVPAAHQLLQHFAFVPMARLDDAMVSWASDGGGVGPHVDSYDVFLLQIRGRRRWRIGRPGDGSLLPGLPLKILRNFVAEQEWLLEPGDMLYLPPNWAHDGVAEGECMTCSIGFRAPERMELADELLGRIADRERTSAARLYGDAGAPATAQPGHIPEALQSFAIDAVRQRMSEPLALQQALGEWLSEPKPRVWFESASRAPVRVRGVRLVAATRMLYDRHFVFINGDSYRASGSDARLMRRLADERRLAAADVARLGADAAALLREWFDQGWIEGETT